MKPVEVPPPDEVTEGWWEATSRHRLTIQGCEGCGGVQHPPRAVCVHCGRTDVLRLRDAAGSGVVDACTVVHRSPVRDMELPYVIARVRLDEGVVVLSRLEGREDPESWKIDDTVEVNWVDLSDGRALPVFRPRG